MFFKIRRGFVDNFIRTTYVILQTPVNARRHLDTESYFLSVCPLRQDFILTTNHHIVKIAAMLKALKTRPKSE